MKLQKQLSRKVGDVEYAKWVLVIPPNIIEELKWKEGQELEAETKENKADEKGEAEAAPKTKGEKLIGKDDVFTGGYKKPITPPESKEEDEKE